jgi:glutathione S-transferase
MVGRLGSGAFVDGYNVGVKRSTPEKQAEYAVVSNVAGFRVEETTNRVFDKRPSKFMIEIYEFEGCPYCKKVREAISILDLDVIFYPCPKGSTKHRDMVMEMGGKQQFPYMRDPNSGVAMYESDDIIAYLFDTYGPAGSEVPRSLNSGVLTTLSCGLALTPRLGKGSRRRAGGNPPTKPLIYWGYEASPFCKVVREVLNELEIPHIQVREPFLSAPSLLFLRCFFISFLHLPPPYAPRLSLVSPQRTVARGSGKRQELLDKKGIFQVPFIEDPNNPDPEFNLFESSEIISYLEKTYG